MTVRRTLTRRIAAATTALFAIAAVATTGAAPVGFTEASWTDDVYVNSSFEASEHAGENYARAASSNGTFYYPANVFNPRAPIAGVVSSVNNLNALDVEDDTGIQPFQSESLLNTLSFNSKARSCARVGAETCINQEVDPSSGTASSVARFDSMRIAAISDSSTLAEYSNPDSTDPVQVTASCSPGMKGETDISSDGALILPRSWPSSDVHVPIPTEENSETSGRVNRLWSYTVNMKYSAVNEINYAKSEISLVIEARTGGWLGILSWRLDILMASAECRLSQPLPDYVFDSGNATNHTVGKAALDAQGETEAELEHEQAAGSESESTSENPESTPPSAATSTGSATRPSRASDSPQSTRNTTRVSTTTTAATTAASVTSTPPSTQTTPTTSATPVIVVPGEPGELSATARTEEAGTVEVAGEELVVVVKGDEPPADAKRGAAALEIWLSGGNPGSSWETFVSSDPDSDGWRWAAINQTTGTVVYIR